VWTNYEYSEEFARRKFKLVACVSATRSCNQRSSPTRIYFLFFSPSKFRNKITSLCGDPVAESIIDQFRALY